MHQISYRLTLACPVYVVLAQYYDYEHISTVHPETLGEYRLVEVRDAGCDVIYDQLWPTRPNRRPLVSRVRHRYVGSLTMEFDFLDVGVCMDGWPGVPSRARADVERREMDFEAAPFPEELTPEQIPKGQGRCYRLVSRSVAVFNAGGRLHALENRCPHTGGPLAPGRVTDDGLCVECPWHGARFRLATGEHMSGPGQANVNVVDLPTRAREQASPTPTDAGGFP